MKYRDWAPTPFDIKGLGLPELQEWIVAPVILTRDSDSSERNGWDNFRSKLQNYNDGEDYQIHRFDHWSCGWLEIILLNPETDNLKKIGVGNE